MKTFINIRREKRSSPQRSSLKKCVLKNFAKFTGKHLCWSLFLITLQSQTLHPLHLLPNFAAITNPEKEEIIEVQILRFRTKWTMIFINVRFEILVQILFFSIFFAFIMKSILPICIWVIFHKTYGGKNFLLPFLSHPLNKSFLGSNAQSSVFDFFSFSSGSPLASFSPTKTFFKTSFYKLSVYNCFDIVIH